MSQSSVSSIHNPSHGSVPPSQKRKLAVDSEGAITLEIESNGDETQVDLTEPGTESAKRKKPAPERGNPNRSQSSTPLAQKAGGHLATEPTTPFAKGTTPSDLPAELYVAVLQRRLGAFATLKTDDERMEEAIRLIPALVRSVSQSNLFVFLKATLDKIQIPDYGRVLALFNDGRVWQKALQRSFPTLCRDFIDCDRLPQFFDLEEHVDSSGVVPSSPTLSERQDESRNSSLQWSTYYYLVYQLFAELMRVTVVATQRVPNGDWREFFSTQHETTFSLLIDTPEDAFVVTPEQFGVIGDIYDIALSTFRPYGTISHYDIVRWYSALPANSFRGEESINTYRDLVTKRDRTLMGQLRYFVYHTQEQFVRTRSVLQIGSSQWWHELMKIDTPMAEHMTAELIEKRRKMLHDRLQQSERELRRLRKELKQMIVENSAAAKNLRDLAFENILRASGAVIPSDDDDDDDIQQSADVIRSVGSAAIDERDVLLAQRLMTHKSQRVQALSEQSSEDEFELVQLDSLLSQEIDSSLEVVSYEVAAVGGPIEQAPLIAGNFALLRSPVKPRNVPVPRNDTSDIARSPHTIMFSDSEDDANDNEEILDSPRARVAFRPQKLDKRITYQSKYRVRLTQILRYFTGWTQQRRGYPISFEFGIVPRFETLTESELFTPVIGNLIWFLALSHVKRRESGEIGGPAQEIEPVLLPDEERTLTNSAESYSTVELYVQKRAFPALAAYVRNQTMPS